MYLPWLWQLWFSSIKVSVLFVSIVALRSKFYSMIKIELATKMSWCFTTFCGITFSGFAEHLEHNATDTLL